jgi:hypothetical protein
VPLPFHCRCANTITSLQSIIRETRACHYHSSPLRHYRRYATTISSPLRHYHFIAD